MFDPAAQAYRWRQLLPVAVTDFTGDDDQRLRLARRLVSENKVKWKEQATSDENRTEGTTRYAATVRGEKTFDVVLELDADGRARYAQCSCSFFRREKLRKGPCAHILAASALLSQQIVAGTAPVAGTRRFRPDVFAGKTFVFTGALTRFTRDEAESLVAQGGGKSAGSVTRITTHLVAGDKAGSKLAKARQMNIPVLTEDEFLQMLEG
jgi:NAD-dependent DNA ligase